MSNVLAGIGFRVRLAEDGIAALREIRNDVPSILVSDLNMPGMSGFELLSVVRRRFPSIHVIAMSGFFTGDEVPSGVAADAFFQKGSSIACLLRLLGNVQQKSRHSLQNSTASAPLWIHRNGLNSSGEPTVTIACPECMRTFPQVIGTSLSSIRNTDCIYCRTSVHYALVPPTQPTPRVVVPPHPSEPVPIQLPQLYN
jgi:CheY-like chemotaxis protein